MNFTLENIYDADIIIGCIMDKLKLPNGITIRQQENSRLNFHVLKNYIKKLIVNNASGSSDDDILPPL